jgi:hypothetical protein
MNTFVSAPQDCGSSMRERVLTPSRATKTFAPGMRSVKLWVVAARKCDRKDSIGARTGRDLLHHNGRDLRELPLFERKARLEKLIVTVNANWLRYSESFDDGA